jgi:UDP-N-acetyl-D-mannosaminuronate dehydrogenase
VPASETTGASLKVGNIVVYESTVYHGLTEEKHLPILERVSGLKSERDFSVGYSPERINPEGKEHTFTKIRKECIQAECRAQRTGKDIIQASFPVLGSVVTVLGLIFKKDCSDLRNSKVIDISNE